MLEPWKALIKVTYNTILQSKYLSGNRYSKQKLQSISKARISQRIKFLGEEYLDSYTVGNYRTESLPKDHYHVFVNNKLQSYLKEKAE